jgi:pimeloyl-ACP methyl ester carboxylesterase
MVSVPGGPGMRDTALLPVVLAVLETCVPDLTMERLPEASHWVMREEPTRLNRLIRDFIGARYGASVRRAAVLYGNV